MSCTRGGLDPHGLGVQCIHLRGTSEEKIMWRSGSRAIRFDVRSGTFLSGPVLMRYALEGVANLGHQLLTLRRFAGLNRLGRLPAILYPPERRAMRWIAMLRVLDALADGANQREIAEGLFGQHLSRTDWRGRSDYLRLRVQRLARSAAQLCDRGYLDLLSSRPPL